jgi:mRNA interferase RelE/StbE
VTVVFLDSFLRDVRKLRDATVRHAIAKAITGVERAAAVDGTRSLKRLSGHAHYYRIRIGDWRVGLKIELDTVTFVRCLHRREVYRFFP